MAGNGRNYFIITAMDPKRTLLFEPSFAIYAVMTKYFYGTVNVRVKKRVILSFLFLMSNVSKSLRSLTKNE